MFRIRRIHDDVLPVNREALGQALRRVRCFQPAVLVVALGLDTATGDPTGTRTLGRNARAFFEGLHKGARTT